jgi:iron(III) transport system substrate-binding protein
MRTRRLVATALLGLASALVAAGCGGESSEGSQATIKSLSGPTKGWYERALKEPPMKYYSLHDPFRVEQTIEAFEEAYPGLSVETLRVTSSDIATRYAQERNTGTRTADVITIADKAFVDDALSKGWFEKLDKNSMPALGALQDRWFDRGTAVAAVLPLGIGYNTEMVDSPPSEWQDVLDPKYRGKIVFPDFRVSPVYADQGRLWIDQYGEDYMKQLETLNPIIVDSMVPGAQLLAAGRGAIMLPAVPSNVEELKSDGAPIDVVFPDDIVGASLFTAISTDSPSSNTARLFYNFIFTSKGQEAFVGPSAASPIGSKGSIPLPSGFTQYDYRDAPEYTARMQEVFQLQ